MITLYKGWSIAATFNKDREVYVGVGSSGDQKIFSKRYQGTSGERRAIAHVKRVIDQRTNTPKPEVTHHGT